MIRCVENGSHLPGSLGRYQVRIPAAQPPACSPLPPLANPLVATLPCLPSVNEVLVLQKRIARLLLYGRLETNFVVNSPIFEILFDTAP